MQTITKGSKVLCFFLLCLFLSESASAQFSIEDMQKEIDAEIDSLEALEIPFEVTLKLKSDIESNATSDGMDLKLEFDVLKVDTEFYSKKTMRVAMHEHRTELLENGFKNGGTYTFWVIKNYQFMEEEPGSPFMVVRFDGAYKRFDKNP